MDLPWAHREMGATQRGQIYQRDHIGVAIVKGILLHTGDFRMKGFKNKKQVWPVSPNEETCSHWLTLMAMKMVELTLLIVLLTRI